jgi:hypothetical protein
MSNFQRGIQVIVNAINAVGGVSATNVKNKIGLLYYDDGGNYTRSYEQFVSNTLNLPVSAYLSMLFLPPGLVFFDLLFRFFILFFFFFFFFYS